ncbi:MAG: sulfite exporter TauE/SafE family protein [Gaiellales bacterium]
MTHALAIGGLGVLAGVISGIFGVGGGVIFVPALTLILGRHQLQAQATSLAAIVPVALAGSWRQHREGLVRWESAAIIGVTSVVGVLAGAEVATSLSNRALERAFGVFLVLVAGQIALKAWRARQAALAEPASP